MLKFGIMGAGGIAHSFCKAAGETDMAMVAAVASKDASRAEAFAKSEGIPAFYGNYEDMLNDKSIDAVYIATTNNFHYDNIVGCLEHGKHVLCEKPLTETTARAEAAIKLAGEKKLFLMEAMWSRFLPKTQKVRQWIADGKIGDVKHIQATIGFSAPRDMTSRLYSKALGGGALYDIGVYIIDLLPYFVNQKLVDISGKFFCAPTGVDVTDELHLQLESCDATAVATFEAVVPEDAYIYGTKGMIRVPKLHWGTDAILFDGEQRQAEHFTNSRNYGFVFELEETVRCIEGGLLESPVASHEMTLESSRIYDRLLQQL